MIRHTGITVKDIELAKEFYKSFGFKVAGHAIEHWGNKRLEVVKMFDADRQVLELIQCRGWPNHFAIQVDSLDMATWDLRTGPAKNDNLHAVQYVQDPWGNWIELVEVKHE